MIVEFCLHVGDHGGLEFFVDGAPKALGGLPPGAVGGEAEDGVAGEGDEHEGHECGDDDRHHFGRELPGGPDELVHHPAGNADECHDGQPFQAAHQAPPEGRGHIGEVDVAHDLVKAGGQRGCGATHDAATCIVAPSLGQRCGLGGEESSNCRRGTGVVGGGGHLVAGQLKRAGALRSAPALHHGPPAAHRSSDVLCPTFHARRHANLAFQLVDGGFLHADALPAHLAQLVSETAQVGGKAFAGGAFVGSNPSEVPLQQIDPFAVARVRREHRHALQPVGFEQRAQVSDDILDSLVHTVRVGVDRRPVGEHISVVEHDGDDVAVLAQRAQVAFVEQVVSVLLRVDDEHELVDDAHQAVDFLAVGVADGVVVGQIEQDDVGEIGDGWTCLASLPDGEQL